MCGLTPLECFFAGATASSASLALLLFLVSRSVVKDRERSPEAYTDPDSRARSSE